MLFLSSRKYDPGCTPRIRILVFYIPDPGSRGRKGTGSRIWIRNTLSFEFFSFFCVTVRWNRRTLPGLELKLGGDVHVRSVHLWYDGEGEHVGLVVIIQGWRIFMDILSRKQIFYIKNFWKGTVRNTWRFLEVRYFKFLNLEQVPLNPKFQLW